MYIRLDDFLNIGNFSEITWSIQGWIYEEDIVYWNHYKSMQSEITSFKDEYMKGILYIGIIINQCNLRLHDPFKDEYMKGIL